MWKSILLAVISGLLFTVGWPTYGFPIFLFVAFVPLLLIEKQFSDALFKKKGLKIFLLSLLAFIIWNGISYSWLSQARPQIDATQEQIGQAWFAYGFAVVVNSLLMALFFLLFHKVRKNHGALYGYTFLVVAWVSFEKMHLNWELSWPWLNLGNGFSTYHEWIQWYSWTGALGGTVWVILVNVFLFLSLNHYLEHEREKVKKQLFIGLSIMLLPIMVSYLIYYNYTEDKDPISVTVLQPELDPYVEKYQKTGDEIVEELLNLADTKVDEQTNFILAPETAFPGRGEVYLNKINQDPLINKIRKWLVQHPNTLFVSGVDAAKITTGDFKMGSPNSTAIYMGGKSWVNRYNSVMQLEDKATKIPTYFKSKLVVGVELFPYKEILQPLLGDAMLDFGGSVNSLTRQVERSVFTNDLNKAKVAPLVCYESIYGEFVSEFVKNGANVLFISTNDSWWGNTQGHKQLLSYAKLRAIENRRSIARSANSGVSAFINQRGDIVAKLDYEEKAALSHTINLNKHLTYYSKYGDVIARISLLIFGVLLAYHLMSIFLKKKPN